MIGDIHVPSLSTLSRAVMLHLLVMPQGDVVVTLRVWRHEYTREHWEAGERWVWVSDSLPTVLVGAQYRRDSEGLLQHLIGGHLREEAVYSLVQAALEQAAWMLVWAREAGLPVEHIHGLEAP